MQAPYLQNAFYSMPSFAPPSSTSNKMTLEPGKLIRQMRAKQDHNRNSRIRRVCPKMQGSVNQNSLIPQQFAKVSKKQDHVKVERPEAELQKSQAEMRLRGQLQKSQAEVEQLKGQLQKSQAEMEQLKRQLELQRTQLETENQAHQRKLVEYQAALLGEQEEVQVYKQQVEKLREEADLYPIRIQQAKVMYHLELQEEFQKLRKAHQTEKQQWIAEYRTNVTRLKGENAKLAFDRDRIQSLLSMLTNKHTIRKYRITPS